MNTIAFLWLPDEIAVKLIPVAIVFGGLLGIVPFLVFLERKVCAFIQDRDGPSRVGLFGPDSPFEMLGINTGKRRWFGGFLQSLPDAVKLITKEAFVPEGADRLLFALGPFFALMPPLLAFIVMPVGPDFELFGQNIKLQVADLNVGILWVLGVASLSAYGLAFGGWASNNKFALLGGVRAMAQMVSYEIGMGIVLLSMIMMHQSVSLREMVNHQAASDCTCHWGIWHQPLAFILFTICAFAENNRLPFDLAECEAELVGGYHTEYNSMHFGMYFQGEYIAILSMGAMIAALFLGGWHYPGYNWLIAGTALDSNWRIFAALLGLASFGFKAFSFVIFSMWVRWSLPRFRWDQLMRIGWKGIVPLALANLLLTAYLNLPAQPKIEKEATKPAPVAIR